MPKESNNIETNAIKGSDSFKAGQVLGSNIITNAEKNQQYSMMVSVNYLNMINKTQGPS